MILFLAILAPFEALSILSYIWGRPELGPLFLWIGLLLAFVSIPAKALYEDLATARE